MKTKIKHIWKILRKKKSERTLLERIELSDLIGAPIRVIIFPIMLIIRLYRWTYE